MNYTIRKYALAKGITLHQAFSKAYRARYDHSDFALIQSDLDRYMNYGAVPPYVSEFMKRKNPLVPSIRTPYYALMA